MLPQSKPTSTAQLYVLWIYNEKKKRKKVSTHFKVPKLTIIHKNIKKLECYAFTSESTFVTVCITRYRRYALALSGPLKYIGVNSKSHKIIFSKAFVGIFKN